MTHPLTPALLTPALLLDEAVMQQNIARMRQHLARPEMVVRPHVKTAKSLPVIALMTGTSDAEKRAARLTVSTLREAAEVIAAGYRDVLYAVGVVPQKLPQLEALARTSQARVSVIVDSVAMAREVFATTAGIDAFIELDVDNHRAGVTPESDELLAIGGLLSGGAKKSRLRGVMTHAGGAYECRTRAELVAMAEAERMGAVRAAERLRGAGFGCDEVSIGSTPTASVAASFAGVSEVRVGVYVFNDLVMAGLGVCQRSQIAVSVLATVVGHQRARNTLLIDAGWMALSSDRSTTTHALDQGLGLVLPPAERGSDNTLDKPLDAQAELVVTGANQEHGLVQRRDAGPLDLDRYPIGTELQILPVHACATAAQFAGYYLYRPAESSGQREIIDYWPRFGGWHA